MDELGVTLLKVEKLLDGAELDLEISFEELDQLELLAVVTDENFEMVLLDEGTLDRDFELSGIKFKDFDKLL